MNNCNRGFEIARKLNESYGLHNFYLEPTYRGFFNIYSTYSHI